MFVFPQVPEMFRAITRDREHTPVYEDAKFRVLIPARYRSGIQRWPIRSVTRQTGHTENGKQQQLENHHDDALRIASKFTDTLIVTALLE